MGIYQQIALTSITGLGLVTGAVIAHHTIEEVKYGVKFIKIFMMSLFYISLFLMIQSSFDNILISAFLPTLIILLIYYFPKKIFKFSKDYLFIGTLAIAFSFNLKTEMNYIISSVIFFNLLCIGTLQYLHKSDIKNKKSLYNSFLIKFLIFLGLSFIFVFF